LLQRHNDQGHRRRIDRQAGPAYVRADEGDSHDRDVEALAAAIVLELPSAFLLP
jgi:hypothetical protein